MDREKDFRIKELSKNYIEAMAKEGIKVAMVLTETESDLNKIFGNCCLSCALVRYTKYVINHPEAAGHFDMPYFGSEHDEKVEVLQ